MPAFEIYPIPAFHDNYFWIIHNGESAIIVDPGDAVPVRAYLKQHQLDLCAILITHHHADHIGGVAELIASSSRRPMPVFGPWADQQSRRISTITRGCREGESVLLPELNLKFEILDVPGHTTSHIAYYCAELASLFCGDTLFAGGCGRLFEGTPAQMVNSLHKIAALPSHTQIYCAHEYTLANLRFALAVEPSNQALQIRFKQVCAAREKGLATVPTQLDLELQTNPFLRSTSPDIIHTLQCHHKLADVTDEVTTFAAIRQWKNSF